MTISRRALFTLDFDRPPASIDRLVRVHRTAMACRVEVALHECDARHVAAARDALDEADRVEALLTVFRESSELSRVNREGAAGAAGVDPEVFGLLQRCAQLYLDTDGAFDITSSPLSRCWGLLTREGRLPSTGEIEAARACIGMLHVDVDATTRSVRFGRDGMALNLNAFGKGYALDCMAATLRARGTDGRCSRREAAACWQWAGPGQSTFDRRCRAGRDWRACGWPARRWAPAAPVNSS